jgi:hypothetical protein
MENRKRTTTKRVKAAVIMVLVAALSFCLVSFTDAERTAIGSFEFLFGYVGILLGFSISIYTYGVQLLAGIADNIAHSGFDDAKKAAFFDGLFDGFKELKEDIWLISFCLALLIALKVADALFCDETTKAVVATLSIWAFVMCNWSIFDLAKSLFNVSEISITLLKKKNQPKK